MFNLWWKFDQLKSDVHIDLDKNNSKTKNRESILNKSK